MQHVSEHVEYFVYPKSMPSEHDGQEGQKKCFFTQGVIKLEFSANG